MVSSTCRTCGEEVETLILAALCELYDRLLADPYSGVARPGYCDAPAVLALELSRDGRLVRAVPLGTQKGKNIVGVRLKVPDRVKRAGIHPDPNFLCDPAEFLLGVNSDTGEADEGATKRRVRSRSLHESVLGATQDDGARAVLSFLSSWRPSEYPLDPRFGPARDVLDRGGNIVFRLEGDDGYIHDRPAVMRAWESHRTSTLGGAVTGQCLVTGEIAPIAVLHKSVSRVAGAQSVGASLVSFNFRAAESYGKTQGANSPVSERTAFAYGTALNWLTSNDRHHALIGDATTVFWAERSGPEEDLLLDLFAESMGAEVRSPSEPAQEPQHEMGSANDEVGAGRLKGVLERVMRGQHVPEEAAVLDEGLRFFVLGLAPNAARVSVRFWHVNTFGGLLESVRTHFEDMAIVHRENELPVSAARLLLETVPATSRKRDSVPKTVIGSLMRSVIEGTAYPQSLYAMIISRIRADANDPDQPGLERKVSHPRAAFIKAHLRRKARITGDKVLEEALTEMLNTENKNPGYLLGRLFALLEKAQREANPQIRSTIKDRYYASASATPGAVFPVLLRLAQHHLAKSEYGGYVDKQIEGVIAGIQSFPAHLNLDQQGLFALGYYQQKAALYKSRESE
jgi:CRISPR-associated protein Csd1